jgi:hypothetical protein
VADSGKVISTNETERFIFSKVYEAPCSVKRCGTHPPWSPDQPERWSSVHSGTLLPGRRICSADVSEATLYVSK